MTIAGMFTAALVAAALISGVAQAAKVGDKAPDFTLTDIHGEKHSLSDFKGKTVVLEWTNYGCPFVQKHYDSGNMQKLQAMMANKEVVWLSICSSREGAQGHMSADRWQKVTEKKGVNSAAVLIDESGKVGRAYGARVTPHMYVIDGDGMIAYNGAIDSIRSTSQADIDRAENYVVAAVEAVLAGKPVETKTSVPYGCGIKYAPQDS